MSGLVGSIADTLKRIPMSQGLMGTLARAAEYAQAQQHGEVALEHLLLALTEDGEAVPVLAASHVDLSLLTADVSQYLGGIDPQASPSGDGQFGISAELKRILEAAAAAASQGRRREINGAIVLAAIVGDGRSSAAHMLRGQGLTFEEAIKALQRAMVAAPATPPVALPTARQVPLPTQGPVDPEHVLATARKRVQSRSAPGLSPVPARPEPTQTVMPDGVPVAQREPEQVPAVAPIKTVTPTAQSRPKAVVAADFRDAMSAEIDAYREQGGFDGEVGVPDDARASADIEYGPDDRDSATVGWQPEVYAPMVQSAGSVAPVAALPSVVAMTPPPVPLRQTLSSQQQLPQLPPDHPVWPEAIPGGPSRTGVRVDTPPPLSGQRWPAPVEPAWRESQPVELPPELPSQLPSELETHLPPFDTQRIDGPPPLPAPVAYAGERPNWADESGLPRSMPPLADRRGEHNTLPPLLPDGQAAGPEFWPPAVDFAQQPLPLTESAGSHQHAASPPSFGQSYGEQAPQLPAALPSQQRLGEVLPASAKARGKPSTAAVVGGQMVENVPRQMRAHTPVAVEVRLAKSELRGLVDGLHGGGQAYRHTVLVAPAMSVRLRAPDGGFIIEPGSPETQWVETRLGLIEADFASWRWTITPKQAGKRRLQLVVSARTFGADGMAADTALPDQIVDVRIATHYGRVASTAASWVAIAVAGGALATFGKVVADPVIAAVMAALK